MNHCSLVKRHVTQVSPEQGGGEGWGGGRGGGEGGQEVRGGGWTWDYGLTSVVEK